MSVKYQLKDNPEFQAELKSKNARKAYLEAEEVYYDKTASKKYRDEVNDYDFKMNGKNAFLQKKKREDRLDYIKLLICVVILAIIVIWAYKF